MSLVQQLKTLKACNCPKVIYGNEIRKCAFNENPEAI